MGNLAVAAARQGCSVVALDGSHAAIAHLRDIAAREALDVVAEEADLRTHPVAGTFDAVVCIGLLMFFDCPTAIRRLEDLQARVRPGGMAIVNVLTEGTTYMDMFSREGHCLFGRDELQQRFAGWHILSIQHQVFPAPAETCKAFVTLMARKPEASPGVN
jgi:tellurite methyltransferase